MKRELGLSVKHAAENVFASGLFDCIEYSIGANFNLEDAYEVFEAKTKEVKEMCKKYNVRMNSYHLPFNGERHQGAHMHAPSSLDSGIRERTLESTKRLIREVADANPRFVILHGSLRVPPEERAQRLDLFVEYVRELCDFCKPYGITVAVETLLESCIGGGGDIPENRIAEHRYIMENVRRDNVGICLDNNHFIKSNSIDFVRELGQYVVTTHFSDYDGIEERHYMPGKGITDWKRLTAALEDKGYKGPWLFEVRFAKTGEPTDEELKDLVDGWHSILGDESR